MVISDLMQALDQMPDNDFALLCIALGVAGLLLWTRLRGEE